MNPAAEPARDEAAPGDARQVMELIEHADPGESLEDTEVERGASDATPGEAHPGQRISLAGLGVDEGVERGLLVALRGVRAVELGILAAALRPARLEGLVLLAQHLRGRQDAVDAGDERHLDRLRRPVAPPDGRPEHGGGLLVVPFSAAAGHRDADADRLARLRLDFLRLFDFETEPLDLVHGLDLDLQVFEPSTRAGDQKDDILAVLAAGLPKLEDNGARLGRESQCLRLHACLPGIQARTLRARRNPSLGHSVADSQKQYAPRAGLSTRRARHAGTRQSRPERLFCRGAPVWAPWGEGGHVGPPLHGILPICGL